jgi:hypothetical protein
MVQIPNPNKEKKRLKNSSIETFYSAFDIDPFISGWEREKG